MSVLRERIQFKENKKRLICLFLALAMLVCCFPNNDMSTVSAEVQFNEIITINTTITRTIAKEQTCYYRFSIPKNGDVSITGNFASYEDFDIAILNESGTVQLRDKASSESLAACFAKSRWDTTKTKSEYDQLHMHAVFKAGVYFVRVKNNSTVNNSTMSFHLAYSDFNSMVHGVSLNSSLKQSITPGDNLYYKIMVPTKGVLNIYGKLPNDSDVLVGVRNVRGESVIEMGTGYLYSDKEKNYSTTAVLDKGNYYIQLCDDSYSKYSEVDLYVEFSDAEDVVTGGTHKGTLNANKDVDLYTLNLDKDRSITLSGNANWTNAIKLELLDEEGNVVSELSNNSSWSFKHTTGKLKAGIYILKVTNKSKSNSLKYEIEYRRNNKFEYELDGTCMANSDVDNGGGAKYWWSCDDPYSISDTLYKKLTKNAKLYDKYKIWRQQNGAFTGMCYGSSITMAMAYSGLIDLSDYYVDRYYDIKASENDKARQMIAYYHLTQYLSKGGSKSLVKKSVRRRFGKKSPDEVLRGLVSDAKGVRESGKPIPLIYDNHVILVYDLEVTDDGYSLTVFDVNWPGEKIGALTISKDYKTFKLIKYEYPWDYEELNQSNYNYLAYIDPNFTTNNDESFDDKYTVLSIGSTCKVVDNKGKYLNFNKGMLEDASAKIYYDNPILGGAISIDNNCATEVAVDRRGKYTVTNKDKIADYTVYNAKDKHFYSVSGTGISKVTFAMGSKLTVTGADNLKFKVFISENNSELRSVEGTANKNVSVKINKAGNIDVSSTNSVKVSNITAYKDNSKKVTKINKSGVDICLTKAGKVASVKVKAPKGTKLVGNEFIDSKQSTSKIVTVKAGKKKATVKVKKVKKIKGYQIQYSTNKKFKSGKKKTLKKYTATKTVLSKLKSKKTYYVRVRTYRTIKFNGKTTKIYSKWSKAKKVKIK